MSRRAWIVCLMLALLPLRGWAASTMMVPAGHEPESMVHAAPADHHAQPPCHEPMASAEAAADSSHNCKLCDLCNSTVASMPGLRAEPPPLPDAAPLIEAARDTGRHLADGLERPPRIPRS
jgi:hypothetical protein